MKNQKDYISHIESITTCRVSDATLRKLRLQITVWSLTDIVFVSGTILATTAGAEKITWNINISNGKTWTRPSARSVLVPICRLVEGVLFSIVGFIGFLGNTLSILVLVSPQVIVLRLF